ncbi:MAG: Asp-tRNA(Asn)/Glu-tRNA(Gln) amidotransferase subunit GatB [Candidatus Omnitrophica bacterium]|nr:Asp-tRNA(Asn)/Glu-tRNA(Gln) amidotransferase subunit GatB [Candidatus Omnitrophota bacterium]
MYETVIGLEVHLQLKTKTKAFCGCANRFGEEPNTLVCPVCLGLPGSLPVLNKKALEFALKVALALNCEINKFFKFDRKNYYYPDLPKNYQISQYDLPLSKNGYIDIETAGISKRIGIRRVHLEEDAGKLIHTENYSLVDYNRAGIPLLEIVTEPDINSPEEAYTYLTNLKAILEYLEVSDCDMEKGSLRCDANISLRMKNSEKLGIKTELKNMNSFKAVRDALDFEIKRQREILEEGGEIIQETRLWDAEKEVTTSMRSKEEAHDYRYFPDPDLVVFSVEDEFLDSLRKSLPELPKKRCLRFQEEYKLSAYDSRVLTQSKSLADYFEVCVKLYPQPKEISNWLTTEILAYLNEKKLSLENLNLEPRRLVRLLEILKAKQINRNTAKEVLRIMLDTEKDADTIIKERNLFLISSVSDIEKIVEEVIEANPGSVNAYLKGKENALMFLVGQVMKKTQGKAEPLKVQELLRKNLQKGGQDA